MIKIPVGSGEYIIVDVVDTLGGIDTLDGASGTFDVRLENAEDWVIQDEPITNTGMRAYCLVDTTGWDVGMYELFLNFTSGAETPRLGPHEFEVVNHA